MKSETYIQVLASGLNFPEGPAFDSSGTLWFVELKGGTLVRFNSDSVLRIQTGGAPNGIAIDDNDEIWFCDAAQCAIRKYNPKSGSFTNVVTHLHGEPLAKPNDLAFDSAGNLVFTCPGGSENKPIGYVCCLRPDGSVKKIASGLFFPNGLVFYDRGKVLIVAETHRQRLWRGWWDPDTATWHEPHPWVEVGGRVGPDGMAVGADGLVYVAVYGAGQIKAVAPDGALVAAYQLPGANPTNCAFDPTNQLGLVVTEAEKGLLLSLPRLGPGAFLSRSRRK